MVVLLQALHGAMSSFRLVLFPSRASRVTSWQGYCRWLVLTADEVGVLSFILDCRALVFAVVLDNNGRHISGI